MPGAVYKKWGSDVAIAMQYKGTPEIKLGGWGAVVGAGWDPVLFVGTGIGKHKTGWVDAVLLLPAWSASVADSFEIKTI